MPPLRHAAAARLEALANEHGRGYLTALAAVAAARVAAAAGRPGDAVAGLHRALDLLSGLDVPLQTAQVRLELARAQAATSQDVAIADARAALRVFDRLGAARDADATAALLRSLGAAGRTGPRGTGALTRREQEVLQLVGQGLSNPDIAERLFISRKTTAHHVSSILSKLGVRNRAEAVAYVTRQQVP